MPARIRTHKSRASGRIHYQRSDVKVKADAIRSGKRWKSVSRRSLKRNPLCFDPLGHHEYDGFSVQARQSHHIIPLVEDLSLAFTPRNIVSLCTMCHSKIEQMILRGDDTKKFFENHGG